MSTGLNEKMLLILHVDDDRVDCMVIGRAIKKLGKNYDLKQVNSGNDALMLLRGDGPEPIKRPDIILLDLNMPMMSGLEFLNELRADPVLRSIHVCVMTTSEDASDVSGTKEMNVGGFIIKPLNTDEFDFKFQILDKYWRLNKFD